MDTEGHGWWQRRSLLATVVVSSSLYLVLLVRFGNRIGSSDLNESARRYFVGVLVTTVVVYLGGLIVAIAQRGRRTGAIALIFGALFGSFWCVVSYGP